MLQLTLIRHAKSSWDNPDLQDYDRPLNARGLRDAPMIGKILKKTLPQIDRLVSSPALRAITTATIIAEKLGYPVKLIRQKKKLYAASVPELLEVIHDFDHHARHCTLVAHNPGLSELSDYLADNMTGDMPTCAVASFIFDVDDWHAVGRNSGQLVLFEYPKKYK